MKDSDGESENSNALPFMAYPDTVYEKGKKNKRTIDYG